MVQTYMAQKTDAAALHSSRVLGFSASVRYKKMNPINLKIYNNSVLECRM